MSRGYTAAPGPPPRRVVHARQQGGLAPPISPQGDIPPDEHHRSTAKSQGQEPCQPAALHRSGKRRGEEGPGRRAQAAQGRRDRRRREDLDPEPGHRRAGLPPRRPWRQARLRRPRQQEVHRRRPYRAAARGRRRRPRRRQRRAMAASRTTSSSCFPRRSSSTSSSRIWSFPTWSRPGSRRPRRPQLARAGFSIAGTPANLNLVRTMRNSLARRISLHRPRAHEIAALERQIDDRARRRRRGERGAGPARSRDAAAPGAPRRIHRSRSTSATTASSASRSRTPRR